jgi:hypothetical protein
VITSLSTNLPILCTPTTVPASGIWSIAIP